MAGDQLVLGGVTFDSWSTPEAMSFGGDQAMKVHKLPGGSRVIQTLGPDEMDISFKGIFWSANSNEQASVLNELRIAGNTIPLTFGGNFYQVVIKTCVLTIHHFPQYYEYAITCVVANNPMAGALGAVVSSLSSIVGADMANALSTAGQ